MILTLLAIAVFLAWVFFRSRALFRVSIRNGKMLVVHGRVPHAFQHELRKAVAHVESGSIRGIPHEKSASLEFTGFDPGTEQQIRNTFYTYPISAIRNAPPIPDATFGQWLGITWLAWALEPKKRL